jgi:hypothetical protein
MTSAALQLLGVLAILTIFVIVFVRPAGILFAILATGIVVAAIVVSWRDVQQYRHQREDIVSSQQAVTNAEAAARAANAPTPARQTGS